MTGKDILHKMKVCSAASSILIHNIAFECVFSFIYLFLGLLLLFFFWMIESMVDGPKFSFCQLLLSLVNNSHELMNFKFVFSNYYWYDIYITEGDEFWSLWDSGNIWNRCRFDEFWDHYFHCSMIRRVGECKISKIIRCWRWRNLIFLLITTLPMF